MPVKDKSVQLCCFSPPYWGLRKYDGLTEILWPDGSQSDLGLEPTPEMYLDHMMLVMGEVWRVLRNDGVCFVNLGDSYSGSMKGKTKDGWFDRSSCKQGTNVGSLGLPPAILKTIKPKSLCLIPQKFAIRCQEAGWIIRSEIIWHKPNPMPESVRDRPTRSHEQVWMMTKQGKYFWDRDAAKEPVAESTIGRGPVDFGGAKGRDYQPDKNDPNYRAGSEQWGRTFDYRSSCKGGRNARDVWTIPTEPTPDAHFASWPTKLVSKMIQAASAPGDIVLDPFCGTGKTVIEAERLNRVGMGLDLSGEYLFNIAKPRQDRPLQRVLNL